MADRSILGAADPGNDRIARLLGAEAVHDVAAEVVEYGLEMMTTGGRWWVSGEAEHSGKRRPFRVFVKLVQSVARSPIMANIPPHLHEQAIRTLPWQVEPDVYRSALAELLPPGTRMPICLGVVDIDDESAAIWLEAVDHTSRSWSDNDYAAAAEALGRLAASESVAVTADRVGHASGPHQARMYWEGRLLHQFAAAYRDEALWRHPLLAAHVEGTLRERLRSLVEAVPDLLDEIEELPLLSSHGDSCPNNILLTAEGLVIIDWGFFARNRIGFDLSQLVWSEIDLGHEAGSLLPHRQEMCLAAFHKGLSAAGMQVDPVDLRRAHDIQLAMAQGITAIPLERLGDAPSTLEPLLVERLVAVDHVLAAVNL